MKKYRIIITILLSSFFSAHVCAEQYGILERPVTEAPDVVEFFSFYCGPCYQFVENYPVSESINQTLPHGKTVTKYHISAMGKMGKALTEAWAIATILGINNKIEKPLFIAVQQSKIINTQDDIEGIFIKEGVSPEEYKNAQHSLIVRSLIAQQESMAEKFSVKGTPSFYIKGRYLINNGKIEAETPDEYVTAFTRLVRKLLAK